MYGPPTQAQPIQQPTSMPSQPAQSPIARPPARRALLIGGLAAAIVLLVGVVATIVVVSLPGKKPKPPPPIAGPACGYKIAYLGPLTADNSGDGDSIRNAAELAVDRYNQQHAGCKAELAAFDTKGDDDEAVRQAGEIVKDDKVVGVVGPVWYSEALKVMPVLDAAGIPAISPSLPYSKLAQSGWKTFHRLVGSDTDQAAASARYLTSTLHAQRVFVVADNDETGIAFSQELRLRLNTAFAGRADINGDEKDYAAVISQITAANADAVYFAGYYNAGGVLVKQLHAANANIKIAGWDRIFSQEFINSAGNDAAEGVVITCPCTPPSEARDNFASTYKDKYHDSPYFSPEAFDAANTYLAALNAGKATRAAVLSYLSTYDSDGVSRRVKFTSTGDLALTSPTIWAYKIKSGTVYKEQAIATG